MKTLLSICALAFIYRLDCLALDKEFKTNITQVTIFTNGAQVFETGNVQLEPGETMLVIKGKSPYLDGNSLQVKSSGSLTILSVNHRSNYLEKKLISQNDSILRVLGKERHNMENLLAESEVLKEKMSLLQTNKNLGGATNGLTMAAFKQALDFYEKEVADIKQREISNRRRIADTKEKIERLERQYNEFQSQPITPVSEIWIKVNAQRPSTANFSVSYLVSGAGWFPKYDVRGVNIQSPIQIEYKAEIWQNTGNDWKNVKIKLSNAEPNRNSMLPQLQKWDLTYARNSRIQTSNLSPVEGTVSGTVLSIDGEPLPGAVVIAKGTSIGTTTDINGRYSITLPQGAKTLLYSFIGFRTIEVPANSSQINVRLEDDTSMLQEIIITGNRISAPQTRIKANAVTSLDKDEDRYEPLATEIKQSQTTLEIEVDKPYTILTNGEKLMVELKSMQLPANFEYFAIPKLDPSAFLVAQVTDWEQLNLLPGEANLYFENTFIGKTVLDPVAFQDTLSISFGRDQSINIKREKVAQFSAKKSVGSNVTESRGYQIQVRNTKPMPIKLNITDQIPVSIVSDITVTPTELGEAAIETERGFLNWKLDIPAQGQKSITFKFEVKYPKREKIVLD